MQIDCSSCNKNCCHNPYLTPILLPAEEMLFIDSSERIETLHRIMHFLKKLEGSCLFFNRDTEKCTNYNKRPLECKIYPFLLDFNGQNSNVKLDKRFCQSLETLSCNQKELITFVQSFFFPRKLDKGI